MLTGYHPDILYTHKHAHIHTYQIDKQHFDPLVSSCIISSASWAKTITTETTEQYKKSKPTNQQENRSKNKKNNKKKIKQVRQLSGLAYIPTCRSPIADHRETQNRPSPTMRRLVSHSTHGPRRSGKFVAPRWRPSNVLSIFRFMTLEGLLLGERSSKEEVTYYPPKSTILQNFSPIAQTMFEICATKFFSLWRWFLTHHGHRRSNLTMPIESPWVLRISAPWGSNVVSVTLFEIFRVKILTVHLLTLTGLTPGPQVTKSGDDLLSM